MDAKRLKHRTIYCRYSGIPLPTYQDFPSLPVDFDAHILMRVPFHLLISEIEERKVLTDRQQRLLFVALLKHTDLCIFEAPALPSERIIEQEFSRLIEITYYIHGHRSFYKTFPKFKITKKDPAISNLTHVIDAWFQVKTSHTWTAAERKELKEIEAFEEIEQKVTQAILKRKPLSPTFNKHLISWALVQSHAPEHKRIKWAKIFLTKESRLCKLCVGKKLVLNEMMQRMEECPACDGTGRTSDIDKLKYSDVQDLRNHMINSLPEETSYESTRKFTVLRHLARKVQMIKNLHHAFGLEILNEVPATDEERKKGKVAKIPEKKDFANLLDYLRATAAYHAAQSQVESDLDSDEIESTEEIEIEEAELKNQEEDEEEDEVDSSEIEGEDDDH